MSLQQVYDPDRIKVPMKRTNPRKGKEEDPGFVPITWDEALDTIADRIMELRRTGETHKYVLWRGRYSYMRDIIYKNMTQIIGSPNNISHSAICAEAENLGPITPKASGPTGSTTSSIPTTCSSGAPTRSPPTGRSLSIPAPGAMCWTGPLSSPSTRVCLPAPPRRTSDSPSSRARMAPWP